MINLNPALGQSHLLEIPLFPEVNYFVQNTELPGVTMNGVDSPYRNNQGKLPSNRIEFDPLSVTFILDENYANWNSLFQWMKRLKRNDVPIAEDFSDITLHLVSSNKTVNKQVIFYGAFPMSITSVPLELAIVDANPVLCTVTFLYQNFEMLTAPKE